MELVPWILGLVDPTQAKVLAYLSGANLVLGVAAALFHGKFELAKLMDFWKRVAIVFLSYVSVALAAKGLADFEPLLTAVWVALIGFLVTQIVSNITELLGIKIPEGLQKWLERS